MAITVTKSNHFKQLVNQGDNHWDTDTYLLILLAAGFTFDKDAHSTYDHADIGTYEIATGNGYTQKTHAVVIASVTEDDVNDRSRVALSAVTITASGAIPDFTQAVIINATSADDTVVCHINYDATISLTDGISFIQSAFNYDEE